MKKKVAFHNLGCKVNSYELDVMRQILLEDGYEEVPFQERADVYVVNTCTVTNIADRKSRQMLHRAKKQNPDAVVVAAGCYTETDPGRVEADGAVDIVVGNNKKAQIGRILADYFDKGGSFPAFREDLARHPAFEDMQLMSPGHTRAYIKIQDGCNQFCSYCIIPYARGRVRSRSRREILCEVEGLVRAGIREIVLTGIHISSYGLGLPEAEGALLSLIRDLHAIDGLMRIRLGSLEPRIMDEPFIAALARLPKVCPHFHLSLQSGCDETLRRMNRHYTTAQYAKSVRLLRQYYDRPAITTDVIVGFPGETEAEFAQTCAFLEEIRFYEIHVFRYSRREGTAAAGMKVQIPEPVKADRSDRLLALTARQASQYRASFAGEKTSLLVEEACTYGGKSYWVGTTTRYVAGAIPCGPGPGFRALAADPDYPGRSAGNCACGAGPDEGMPEKAAQGPGMPDGGPALAPGILVEGVFLPETIPFSRGPAMVFGL